MKKLFFILALFLLLNAVCATEQEAAAANLRAALGR
jgi:hypothetical protein